MGASGFHRTPEASSGYRRSQGRFKDDLDLKIIASLMNVCLIIPTAVTSQNISEFFGKHVLQELFSHITQEVPPKFSELGKKF